MMPDSAIATAADYADAMLTARRAKNLLVLLTLLILLIQIGLFFTARYTNVIFPQVQASAVPASTQPTTDWRDLLKYLIGASNFLGVIFPVLLGFILLLIVKIMLVGRLIGVARTTSAYIWCLLLIALLFPWQAFLSNMTFTSTEFKIPGVLYTWEELTSSSVGARFTAAVTPEAILKWARYVGWPLVAVILLLIVQVKSNRGLRQAFGEDVPVETLNN